VLASDADEDRNTMTLRVPFIADETIERDAEALLAQYAHAKNIEIKPPIPIDDIVEKHLKLHVEFNDLQATKRPCASPSHTYAHERAREIIRELDAWRTSS
jgi:hypothetical protein